MVTVCAVRSVFNTGIDHHGTVGSIKRYIMHVLRKEIRSQELWGTSNTGIQCLSLRNKTQETSSPFLRLLKLTAHDVVVLSGCLSV